MRTKSKSILDTDTHLVNLFDYLVGDVPPMAKRFSRWAMRSAIAGTLANRVWVTKQTGGLSMKLYPNLYVLFLAGSAGWKSWAIRQVHSLLRETDYKDRINLFDGRLTHAGMYDAMLPSKKHPNNNRIYIVMEELAALIGTKEYADQLIKSWTMMYYSPPFKDMTRTNGLVDLGDQYCLNLLMASTFRWIERTLTFSAVEGGFFPRTNTIIERGYAPEEFDPPPPVNSDEVKWYIIERMNQALRMKGEFVIEPDAYEWEREWFTTREQPKTDLAWSYFNRQRDWMRKLAMGESVASGDTMHITISNMQAGLKAATEGAETPTEVLRRFDMTQQGQVAEGLKDDIRRNKNVNRTELVRWAEKKGVTGRVLDDFIDTWKAAGYMTEEVVKTAGRPKRIYHWIPAEENDNE